MNDVGYTTAGYGTAAAQNAAFTQKQEAVEGSPFLLMGLSAQNVSALCARVHQLADRLSGGVPTPIGEARNGGATSGGQPPLFHALRLTAEQIRGETESAMQALDRIERALP